MLDKRLVIVSGKGGVGKSAVASGLALLAQRHGLRVLIIEMESGGGLPAHFGTGPLAFEPTEVRPGLHAMEMVRSQALLEYLQLQLKLPGKGRFGAVARAFDALATAAPAVREIVTIGKILWEVKEDKWDLVVVDAPPTGQIASYLRAPQSISELVATGRIRNQADWMAATLADPALTALLLVTLPEELPTTETLETMSWVEENAVVSKPTVIANRVLEAVTVEVPGEGIAADMVTLQASLVSEQERWLEKLPPDLTLPYMFGLFTPPEVAAHISDELEALR
jgi:anion-transporting  ArsA/GET3 family ATPase